MFTIFIPGATAVVFPVPSGSVFDFTFVFLALLCFNSDVLYSFAETACRQTLIKGTEFDPFRALVVVCCIKLKQAMVTREHKC